MEQYSIIDAYNPEELKNITNNINRLFVNQNKSFSDFECGFIDNKYIALLKEDGAIYDIKKATSKILDYIIDKPADYEEISDILKELINISVSHSEDFNHKEVSFYVLTKLQEKINNEDFLEISENFFDDNITKHFK